MKYGVLFLVLCTLLFIACGKDNVADDGSKTVASDVELSIVDKNATTETKALLSQLWRIPDTGFMFGHHDDLIYGRTWYNEAGGSDTKAVCGDYPGVFSVDFAEVMDDRCLTSTDNAIRKRCIIEARARGEVILACCHLNNPVTNGDAWDNSDNTVVRQILTEGSAANVRFKVWLDRLAAFVSDLKDNQGKLIPVIFRPFHEHTQTWSWWGAGCTTEAEFINLWRFTVNYLRDTRGVHQFLYAISPQLDGVQTKDYLLYRWPGDDYVDFLGMDCYHGLNTTAFMTNIRNISLLSKEKKKPCGVTETGIEGIVNGDGSPCTDYWTKQILTPAIGYSLSMIVMWRNKYDPVGEGSHFYSVFPGQASVADFITMYKSSVSLFCKDLPDMYKPADNVTVK
jgi:mannan endo-1,4-beta-mannosidase